MARLTLGVVVMTAASVLPGTAAGQTGWAEVVAGMAPPGLRGVSLGSPCDWRRPDSVAFVSGPRDISGAELWGNRAPFQPPERPDTLLAAVRWQGCTADKRAVLQLQAGESHFAYFAAYPSAGPVPLLRLVGPDGELYPVELTATGWRSSELDALLAYRASRERGAFLSADATVYTEPSAGLPIIAQLDAETPVTISDCENGWCPVRLGSKWGYILESSTAPLPKWATTRFMPEITIVSRSGESYGGSVGGIQFEVNKDRSARFYEEGPGGANWRVGCKLDVMDDTWFCSAYQGDLWLFARSGQLWGVDIGDDHYPGTNVVVRIDKGSPQTVKEPGWRGAAAARLLGQLAGGTEAALRYREWPWNYNTDSEVSLAGSALVIDYIRHASRR